VPWYDTYRTADGEWVAVGAREPKFYAEFTRLLGLSDDVAAFRDDLSMWPRLRMPSHTPSPPAVAPSRRAVFEGTDACVAPVLSLTEAASHPHLAARDTDIDVGGVTQPAPLRASAGRFHHARHRQPAVGADTVDMLRD
jgi:alpha-methylacyl-CoA racemase